LNTVAIKNDENITYEVRRSQIAAELLRVATGQAEGAREYKALSLDKEAIFALKFYERDGLSLPQTLSEVFTYVGEVEIDIEGLTNQELLNTYTNIRENASGWAQLEDGMKSLSLEIDNFSSEMLTKGGRATDFLTEIVIEYGDIDFGEIGPEILEDEAALQALLEQLNNDPNAAEDHAGKLALTAATIDSLKDSVLEYYQKSDDLLTRIKAFNGHLVECLTDVAKKESLCDNLNLQEEVDNLRDQRKRIQEQIQVKEGEYDSNVKKAALGVIGGVFVVAITGSIFGKRAAAIRKEIDGMKAQIRAIDEEIETLDKVVRAVTNIDGRLEGMFSVMIQAEKGIEDVKFVWETMHAYLQESHDACQGLTDAASIAIYTIEVMDMVDPWNEVSANALEIHNVFDEALTEWANSITG